jgi:hypothetical protein
MYYNRLYVPLHDESSHHLLVMHRHSMKSLHYFCSEPLIVIPIVVHLDGITGNLLTLVLIIPVYHGSDGPEEHLWSSLPQSAASHYPVVDNQDLPASTTSR